MFLQGYYAADLLPSDSLHLFLQFT